MDLRFDRSRADPCVPQRESDTADAAAQPTGASIRLADAAWPMAVPTVEHSSAADPAALLHQERPIRCGSRSRRPDSSCRCGRSSSVIDHV